jgi:hypothetical protein
MLAFWMLHLNKEMIYLTYMSDIYYDNQYRIFLVLAHWNNGPQIDMSLQSYTVLAPKPTSLLVLFVNAVCLA